MMTRGQGKIQCLSRQQSKNICRNRSIPGYSAVRIHIKSRFLEYNGHHIQQIKVAIQISDNLPNGKFMNSAIIDLTHRSYLEAYQWQAGNSRNAEEVQ
jgi:hypothetical protein